ncbi:hypothetical protein KUTeg_005129 [Tegillarca granosa]|uniref:DUF4371 domain-containing protein n=1 Tax=Tegillarca granosa TaxID=220873 RepID=A0ABQ9FIW3_TEGGR|nr:hypothetical protein KUTeg_005129 [Tegillarca granosa]
MRYLVSKDAVYCVHCVLFGSAESKEKSFIAPISDWVNFSTYVKRHELSSSHNHNKTFSERFLGVATGKQESILSSISYSHKDYVARNRHILKKIIEVLLLCAKQNNAIRGHTEDKSNFMAILQAFSQDDEVLYNHLNNPNVKYRYTSPDIQNEILQICASQFFAILADECTDKSTKEQLSICLRYLCKERDSINIHEDFVCFVEADSTKGELLKFKEELNSNEFAKGEMDKRTKLRTLCETRWSSRADALHTFKSSFSVVVSSLEALQADGDEKASARLGAILRFDFIIALIITDHILSGTVALSNHLQSVKCDLLEAVKESKTVIQMFMNERANDNVWDTLYNTAPEMAAEFDIEPVVPRQVRRQQNRANYQMVDPKQYWKVSLYFVFLDHLIGELQSRLIDSEGRFLGELLLPSRLQDLSDLTTTAIYDAFSADLTDRQAYDQEIKRWRASNNKIHGMIIIMS